MRMRFQNLLIIAQGFTSDNSDLCHAAIDKEFYAVHVAAFVRDQEQNDVGNLIGQADAAERNRGTLGGDETGHLLFC